MNKFLTMDANTAVARVAYKFSEICGIYPITPASPIAEKVDVMSSDGEKNFFGNTVKVTEMQSEAGAIAIVHGALESGILATTFTASQGLLLMIPSLYKLAGEMLPGVIHVAARSLSTHALSIFGDHQDIYATRQTGVCLLASSSPTEAYHMAMVAHLSAIESLLPFIHFFDGFRTSHEIDKIPLVKAEDIKNLINFKSLEKFHQRAMNNTTPNTRGTNQNDDIYFQNTESRNSYYTRTITVVNNYMQKINKIAGTNYKPFNYYGDPKATDLIVAMGSVCETIKETIDYLNSQGNHYGLVEVHLYRPFSEGHLKRVIPATTKRIAVLDRTKEAGSLGEPLYLDIVSALKDTKIDIIGGRYGLSSKNTTPAMIKGIYDFLSSSKRHHNFTIGINDDVTNLSIDYDENFKIPNKMTEFLIYGYGSDGMVSTCKDIIKIIGDNTNNFVQGYFQYDSKKSGGVTRSHIRINKEPIRSTYYVDNPSLVVITKDSYIYKYDMLTKIKDKGTVILNTSMSESELIKTLPNKVKKQLASKKLKLYIVDAYNIANKLGLKNKISTCMEVCIFKIINILNEETVKKIMKENNEKRFAKKGSKIVEINNNIVDASFDILKEVKVDKKWSKLEVTEANNYNFDEMINHLQGDSLPVSAFIDKRSGIFEAGSTKYEKREIAESVPCWNKENCIECNKCAFVCPHAVIRPFLLDSKDNNVPTIPSLFPKDKNFAIGVSYQDCTGCGLCANICPGKQGKKALTMKPYDKETFTEDTFNYLMENNQNEDFKAPVQNVKNTSFIMPKFEFSGACAGCGETAYLKNLTQVFNNNLFIANATGCSSIYGAAAPSTPYSIPWASSLFEDNSEFGLGITLGINLKREKIQKYMEENLSKDHDLFTKWLDNKDDFTITSEVQNEIDYQKHPYLSELKDYIPAKSIWVVGGDGFAYDIGYGGLDHVLSTNNNINILVLDTEVYSNTGGQSSKSSNLGSIASFTAKGKTNYKKDLARIAMCYPHVYVATTNIGYNSEQYLKVLKEASAHNGPSLVIAYAPCIEHGIKTGMEHSLDNAMLATKSGYFLTFRSNPDTNTFTLDSKDVDFNLYDDFLMTENRYANLKNVNKEHANEILEQQKQWAINRYEYYQKLDPKDN